MDKVVKHFATNGGMLVLIRWEKYGPDHDTIQPVEDIGHNNTAMRQYIAEKFRDQKVELYDANDHVSTPALAAAAVCALVIRFAQMKHRCKAEIFGFSTGVAAGAALLQLRSELQLKSCCCWCRFWQFHPLHPDCVWCQIEVGPQLQMLAITCLYFSRFIQEGSPTLPNEKSVSVKSMLPDQCAFECGPDFAALVWKRTPYEYCAGIGELRPSILPVEEHH